MEPNRELIRELRRLVAGELAAEAPPLEELTPTDLQWELDILGEIAMKVGEQVFSLDWDSGGLGAGAGSEIVYRIADRYLYLSATFGWTGPFETLDEAHGTIWVSAATQSISSSEWSVEEIIARMQLGDGPAVLIINGETWPFELLEHRYKQLTGSGPADRGDA